MLYYFPKFWVLRWAWWIFDALGLWGLMETWTLELLGFMASDGADVTTEYALPVPYYLSCLDYGPDGGIDIGNIRLDGF